MRVMCAVHLRGVEVASRVRDDTCRSDDTGGLGVHTDGPCETPGLPMPPDGGCGGDRGVKRDGGGGRPTPTMRARRTGLVRGTPPGTPAAAPSTRSAYGPAPATTARHDVRPASPWRYGAQAGAGLIVWSGGGRGLWRA